MLCDAVQVGILLWALGGAAVNDNPAIEPVDDDFGALEMLERIDFVFAFAMLQLWGNVEDAQ